MPLKRLEEAVPLSHQPTPTEAFANDPDDGHADTTPTSFVRSQPTSISEMLERGMDVGSQAKELRRHLRSMSSNRGVQGEGGRALNEADAQQLVEMSKLLVRSMEEGQGRDKKRQPSTQSQAVRRANTNNHSIGRQVAPINPTSSRVPGKNLGPQSQGRQPSTKSGVGVGVGVGRV